MTLRVFTGRNHVGCVDAHEFPCYPINAQIVLADSASGCSRIRGQKRRLTAFAIRVMWRCVMRFLSTISGRLDGKGRVSIPAPFRAVLEMDGYPGLFVHPALEVPALEAGGNRLLGEIDGLIARYPPYSDGRDLIATALLGAAEILKLDPEGRVVLPERFKALAGITGEIVFVGLGDKFRMWEPNRFSAHLAEAKARLRALRAELSGGNPERGSGQGGPET